MELAEREAAAEIEERSREPVVRDRRRKIAFVHLYCSSSDISVGGDKAKKKTKSFAVTISVCVPAEVGCQTEHS